MSGSTSSPDPRRRPSTAVRIVDWLIAARLVAREEDRTGAEVPIALSHEGALPVRDFTARRQAESAAIRAAMLDEGAQGVAAVLNPSPVPQAKPPRPPTPVLAGSGRGLVRLAF